MSLDAIARAVINLLQANPRVQAQLQWDLSIEGMTLRIEEYNAQVCLQLGYPQYVLAEGGQPDPPPFLGHPSHNPSDPGKLAAAASSVKKIWAGIRTISEWIDVGAPAVPAEKSEQRAATCIACSKHGPGDFGSWFAKPAAEGIKRLVERAKDFKLSTPYDDKLNVCSECLCPMRLKVHMPIEIIRNGTNDETIAGLRQAPACWIVKEIGG